MQPKRGVGDARMPEPHALEAKLAPMRSAVGWALLGLVIERPSHGYELAARFRSDYEDLLALSDVSYVYRALEMLERRGWIEPLPDDGQPRRAKKTSYRSTESGEDAYQEHLIAQMTAVDQDGRLFARKLGVFAHRPKRALAVIEHAERACVAHGQQPPATEPDRAASGDPGALAARLHADRRRRALTATVAWLQFARGEIEALAHNGGLAP